MVQTLSRSNFAVGSYELPKSQDSNRDNFGTISGLQLGSPGKKCHSGASAVEWHREYYREDGGGTSRVRAVVCLVVQSVAPLLWPSVGVKPNTWKSRELESSGTFECSELNNKAQNTLPWGVTGVIAKVSKCRCPQWPRIGHLDICSPSYGQKKGRESNWQFDFRPLKVGNRPVLDVRSGSATRRWKALFEGYRIGLDLVAIRGRGEELWL